MTNVFQQVYEHMRNKPQAPKKSLFNALNREHIQAIILHDGVWWTEQHTTSKGLTSAQHRTLKEHMQRTYDTPWLYDAAPIPTMELNHTS